MDKEKARELAEEYKGYSHELRKIFNNMMKNSVKKADDWIGLFSYLLQIKGNLPPIPPIYLP